jgi:hypothetical protein
MGTKDFFEMTSNVHNKGISLRGAMQPAAESLQYELKTSNFHHPLYLYN